MDSGVSSVVMNYYSRLIHDRVTFDFMLNEDVDAKTRAYIEGNGSKIYVMPALKVSKVFKYIKALKEFYASHSYAVIHGHIANSAVFYLGLAKNVPYRILHSHSCRSSDIAWKRARNWVLTRYVGRVANRYMACSEEAAKFLFGTTDGVTILNNAIDVEAHEFNADKREMLRFSLGVGTETVIGHVGRFEPVKNHTFLIEVFDEIYKVNRNVRLLLIGDGKLRGNIIQNVKERGIAEAVLFLDKTEEIGGYMSAMDIFVLPSLFEGMGMAGIEAQASGLEVVASEKIPRALDISGEVEFLPLDRDAWVRRLSDPHVCGDRAERGKKLEGGQFDLKTQNGRLCDYYEKLLEEN